MNGPLNFDHMSGLDDCDSMSDLESASSNASTDIDVALGKALAYVLSNRNEDFTMSPPHKIRRDEYTVGWICALPVEFAAAMEVLDELHQDFEQDEHDRNEYALGRVCEHNVVIAHLSADPTNPNSSQKGTEQMKSAFPGIRLVLMAEAGADIPRTDAYIRFEDFWISQLTESDNGSLQHNDEKSTPSGVERTTLRQILLAAIAKLRRNHARDIGRPSQPTPGPNMPTTFYHRDLSDDKLFETRYNHKEGSGSLLCDVARKAQREERTELPVISYGTIGLRNQVIEDGATGSHVGLEFATVLCSEMEVAEASTSFPCVVIRGLCDYANSNNSKKWLSYAEGAASFYAKELLSVISRDELAEIDPAGESIKVAAKVRNAEGNWDNNIRELGRLEQWCSEQGIEI